MCEYCEQPYKDIVSFTDDVDSYLYIFPNSDEGATIAARVEFDNGEFVESEFTVPYCPMCGKKY